jgi:WD40 repeat protein
VSRIGTVRFRTGSTVQGLRFSPDGKQLVSAGFDAVCVWEVRSGKALRKHFHVRTPDQQTYRHVEFAPDGKNLWLQTHEGQLFLWNLSADPATPPAAKHFEGPTSSFMTLMPDGKHLVTGGDKKGVRLLAVASGKAVREIGEDLAIVDRVSVSADGRFLLSGTKDTLILWEAQSGKVLHFFPEENKARVEDKTQRFRTGPYVLVFSLSPDGKTVAAAYSTDDGEPNYIRIYDAGTGKVRHTVQGSKHGEETVLMFSPDSRFLALGCHNFLGMWDVDSGKKLWESETGSNDVSFSADGKTLASASADIVRLWDVSTGKETGPIPEHRDGLRFAQLTPDGRRVITEGWTSPVVHYWDAATGRKLADPWARSLQFAAVSADAKTLIGYGQGKEIEVWDTASGKVVRRIPYQGHLEVHALSADGKLLLTGERVPDERGVSELHSKTKLHLIDVTTGQMLGLLAEIDGLACGTTFSPNGKLVATLDFKKKTLHVWDAVTRRQLHERALKERIFGLTFSPDSTVLAVWGDGVTFAVWGDGVTFWDMANGQELPKPRGNLSKQETIHVFKFFPDGKTLVTSDNYGKVFLWDRATGDLLREWQAHLSRVEVLSLSADGKRLLTLGAGTAMVWDIDRQLGKKE